MLIEAWRYLLAHPAQFAVALGVHVTLSAAALAIGAAIAIPVGLYAAAARASRSRPSMPRTSAAHCRRSPCSRS